MRQRKERHITIRIDAGEAKALEELARQNERSLSAELRIAIRGYLADEIEKRAA